MFWIIAGITLAALAVADFEGSRPSRGRKS